jgi:hypothetical protein
VTGTVDQLRKASLAIQDSRAPASFQRRRQLTRPLLLAEPTIGKPAMSSRANGPICWYRRWYFAKARIKRKRIRIIEATCQGMQHSESHFRRVIRFRVFAAAYIKS